MSCLSKILHLILEVYLQSLAIYCISKDSSPRVAAFPSGLLTFMIFEEEKRPKRSLNKFFVLRIPKLALSEVCVNWSSWLALILKDEPRKPLSREVRYFFLSPEQSSCFYNWNYFCVLFSLHNIPCNTIAEYVSIPCCLISSTETKECCWTYWPPEVKIFFVASDHPVIEQLLVLDDTSLPLFSTGSSLTSRGYFCVHLGLPFNLTAPRGKAIWGVLTMKDRDSLSYIDQVAEERPRWCSGRFSLHSVPSQASWFQVFFRTLDSDCKSCGGGVWVTWKIQVFSIFGLLSSSSFWSMWKFSWMFFFVKI